MNRQSSNIFLRMFTSCFLLVSIGTATAQDSPAEKGIGVEAVETALSEVAGTMKVPNRFAVIIGANDYIDNRIPDLPACENDAIGLYEALVDPLVGMFPKEHVALLVDDQVTENSVIEALDYLGRRAGKEDLVLIFFSGHGAIDKSGRSYWIMHDTKIDRLRSTGLSENEITSLIDDIQSNRLVTLIDACYSASTANIGGSKSLVDINQIYPEFQGQGRVAITASAGDQLSVVIPEDQLGYGYSAFAYHLIQGLKGKADGTGGGNQEGVITVDELWSYVKDRTASTARLAGGNQQPQLIGQIGSQFMLTIDSKQLISTSKIVQQRLKFLKGLFLDEHISNDQYAMATQLIQLPGSQLGEYDRERQKIAEDLADGKLNPQYLSAAIEQLPHDQSLPISTNVGVEPIRTAPNTPTRVVPEELHALRDQVVIWENRMRISRSALDKSNEGEQHEQETKIDSYTKIQNLIAQGNYQQASKLATQLSIRFERTAITCARQWWRHSMQSYGEMPSNFEQSRAFWLGLASTSNNPSALAGTLAIEGAGAVDEFDGNGFNALHYAAWLNNSQGVSFLLDQGLDPNIQILQSGTTPLMLAAKNGSVETIQLLIDSGSDIEYQDENIHYQSALLIAVLANQEQAVLKLVRLGADISSRDSVGATPLHYAATNGFIDIVSLLSGLGADPSLVDNSGNTPIHNAAHQGHSDVIRKLIDLGSDPNTKNRNGYTPLSLAVIAGSPSCVSAFNSDITNFQVPTDVSPSLLHHAVLKGTPEMIDTLLTLGADIDFSDDKGQTALHLASRISNLGAVITLLTHGASVESTDTMGKTALHFATKGADEGGQCLRELLNAGASIESQDDNGNTPLHLAAFYGFGPHDPDQGVEALKLLIDAGADLTAMNTKGRTALQRLEHSKRVDKASRAKMLTLSKNGG